VKEMRSSFAAGIRNVGAWKVDQAIYLVAEQYRQVDGLADEIESTSICF
jgi:hypothetical protein